MWRLRSIRELDVDDVCASFAWLVLGIAVLAMAYSLYEADEFLKGGPLWRNMAIICSIATIAWLGADTMMEHKTCVKRVVVGAFWSSVSWILPSLVCQNFVEGWIVDWKGLIATTFLSGVVAFFAFCIDQFLRGWCQKW